MSKNLPVTILFISTFLLSIALLISISHTLKIEKKLEEKTEEVQKLQVINGALADAILKTPPYHPPIFVTESPKKE